MARKVLSLLAILVAVGLLIAGPSSAQSTTQEKPSPSKAEPPAQQKAAEPATQPTTICLTAEDLTQIKAINGRLASNQSPCDTCIDISSWIIGQVGCGAGEAVLAGTCTLAEIVFFAAEEIVAPICTGLEIGLGVLCAEYGADWIAAHTRDAGNIICQNITLCPKSTGP